MPDKDGKLTPEEMGKINAWMSARHKLPCQVCGNRQWATMEHIVQPITLGPDRGLVLGSGLSYPQVMLVCRVCGNTLFFNAVLIGLAPAATPDEKA